MVTMRDISRKAGASRTVVSKVLAGGSDSIRVSEKTAEKIRNIALEMGYMPNSAARTIKNGRFNSIALLQSCYYVYSMLSVELLSSIQRALNQKNMHLIFSELPDEKLVNKGFIPKILTELYADGLLINYNTMIPEKMIDLIRKHRIPSVWINSKQEFNCVYPDDFNASRKAAEFLFSLGHEKIAFARFTGGSHYSAHDREAGYLYAMNEAGFQHQLFCTSKNIELKDSGKTAIEFLKESERPTAIICYTEKEFLSFYHTAIKLGMKIPEDLSLITFSPKPFEFIDMIASTCILPEKEIGKKSVEILLALIEDPKTEFPPVKAAFNLYKGDTTTPI